MRKKPEGWTNQDYHRHYLYLDISQRVKKTDSLLEIGCGNGNGPAHMGPPLLAEKAKRYLAIDKKRYKGHHPFRFVRGDFVTRYLMSKVAFVKYDKIVALYVIAYVQPVKFFKRISRILKPGGTAYFSEGMAWQRGESRLTPEKLYALAERDLGEAFRNVEIIGIENGILVDEIKTGVFLIASN